MKRLFLTALSLAIFFQSFSQDYCSMARMAPFIEGSVAPGYSQKECLYDVKFYFISVEADDSTADIIATTTINFQALLDIDTLVFELTDSEAVDSVILNGINQNNYIHENELLKIIPEVPLDKESSNTVTISYAGTSSAGGFFTGLSNGKDFAYNKQVTYTLSEPFESKDWFPVKQDLSDKADSVWVFITTREGLMGGSNGMLTNISYPSPGKVRYEWKTRYPTDFYLISFTVADYIDYSFYAVSDVLGDSLLIQNFIYNSPGILDRQKDNIDITTDFIIYFSELFGKYPFIREKYGHCMAPIGGGMEHQTMTTLQNFDFSLVSHELTHQWFGDHVTCGSWRDIWLNEGFASYGEYLALDKFKGRDAALKWLSDAHDRAIASSDKSIYLSEVEAKNTARIFDYNTTYKKGASIIHMLRYELNDDSLFFGILREYQKTFADSSAVAEDLLKLINDLSGSDYSWFFDQWYYGTGYPVFETSWQQVNDSLILDSYQIQINNVKKIFKTHMDFQIIFSDDSDTIFRLWNENESEHFVLPVDKEVISVIADPNLNILMKPSVYRVSKASAYYEVSPNPFTQGINIYFNNPLSGRKLYIVNPRGQLVYQNMAEEQTMHLELSGLEQGIFLLVILTSDGKKFSSRIVKVREK